MSGMWRGRWGRTLLETVIVLAIIAILLALFTPCLVKARQMARRTVDRVEGKHR